MAVSCVFCEILAGDRPAHMVHQDADVAAFMDAFPSTDGHVLVVPVRHLEDVYALDDALAARIAVTVRRVACAIRAALAPDGLNVTQANGAAAGQTVPHLHLHLLPRTAGERLGRHGAAPGDPDRLAALAARIAAEL